MTTGELEKFLITNVNQLLNSTLNESEVEDYNNAIRAKANHFLIYPPQWNNS
jgi:hypothetical protein